MNVSIMKKHTNRILLVVLFVLLSAFVLTKVFRSPRLESNLDTNLLRIDTGKVATIRLYTADREERAITFKRNNNAWTIQQQDKNVGVQRYQVNSLLQTLSDIRPERMVSRKKEKWDDYQVGDSSAFRMVAYNGEMEELANWNIGKQSQGMTYLRPGSAHEVYAVEGSLRTRLHKGFDEWRDKSFLRIDKSFINNIAFRYPSDSSFVLEKKDRAWMIGNEKADSAKVEDYLYQMQSKDLTSFADGFSPSGEPDVTVMFMSDSALHAEVKGWKQPGGKWVLSSGLQEGIYFRDSTFMKDLFAGRKAFLGR